MHYKMLRKVSLYRHLFYSSNSVLSGGFRIYSFNTYSDDSMLSVTLTQWRFYCVMLCIRGTNHGPVSVCLSVCLSVTSRCSTKTVKRRIT